ncbi:hypothetical protein E2542_SST10608 [Spatholobus suberectus]|nr:hypothetical protein E2542_SST10608 [Spatholobus suberectus]
MPTVQIPSEDFKRFLVASFYCLGEAFGGIWQQVIIRRFLFDPSGIYLKLNVGGQAISQIQNKSQDLIHVVFLLNMKSWCRLRLASVAFLIHRVVFWANEIGALEVPKKGIVEVPTMSYNMFQLVKGERAQNDESSDAAIATMGKMNTAVMFGSTDIAAGLVVVLSLLMIANIYRENPSRFTY